MSEPAPIVVVADTHLPRGGRRLPNLCLELIGSCELLIHAGDFSTAEVHDRLAAIAPRMVAVHGNVDDPALRRRLPERVEIEWGGARIGVIHDAGPRRGRLERMRRAFANADAVVFGHSHMPLQESDGRFQIFNPGSPTERRRAPTRAMGVADLAAGALRFRHIEL